MSAEHIFYPWVGTDYRDGLVRDTRVLIVGESHYDEQFDEEVDLTKFVVLQHCSGARRRSFLTKLQRAFERALDMPKSSAQEFWSCAAFFNYVQAFVPKGGRPTGDQGQASQAGFMQVLLDLAPDFVLCAGFTLWDFLPEPRAQRPVIVAPMGIRRCLVRTYADDWNQRVSYIQHPSARGYSGASTAEWIRAAWKG